MTERTFARPYAAGDLVTVGHDRRDVGIIKFYTSTASVKVFLLMRRMHVSASLPLVNPIATDELREDELVALAAYRMGVS